MFDFFNKKEPTFSSHIPWDYMIEDGVIVNKNMGFQVTLKIKNHDLDYFTSQEVNLKVIQWNNAIKKLPDNFIIHYEVQRKRTNGYIKTNIEGKKYPTKILEAKREQAFANKNFFKCDYYITITYLLSDAAENRLNKILTSTGNKEIDMANEWEKELKYFKQKILDFVNLLKYSTIDIEYLQDDKLLGYLYSTINFEFTETKKTPPIEMKYPIDQYLSASSFEVGREVKINDKLMTAVSINIFPDEAGTRVLKEMESLNFEFRMVARYIILSDDETKKMIKNSFLFHQGKQKTFMQYVLEAATKQPTYNVDQVEIEKSKEAEMALNEFKTGGMSYGYYTLSIMVVDDSRKKLEEKISEITAIFSKEDFVSSEDKFNIFESFLGSIPGNLKNNIRKSPLNSIIISNLFSISTLYSGEECNKHLNVEPLISTKTGANDVFYFNLHVKDIAHAFLVGPTGSGKSVILGEIAGTFYKYPNSQIFYFDKNASSRVLTELSGGEFYDLGADELAFQPLAKIDNIKEKEFARDWIVMLLEQENVIITPEIQGVIWETLSSLALDAPHNRTMTNFVFTAQNKLIQQALQLYTNAGAYGRYFDAREDKMSNSSWQTFEMDKVMNTPKVFLPILDYLFHRIETEKLTKGKPTLIIIDESKFILDNEHFSRKLDSWLRTFRKLNAGVILATQSLDEIVNSSIKAALLDSCQTQIMLPNPAAMGTWRHQYSEIGYNEVEIETIALAETKKDYFYKSQKGSRKFELSLSPIEIALTGSSGSLDQLKIQELKKECNTIEELNLKWLEYKLGSDNKDYLKFKEMIGAE